MRLFAEDQTPDPPTDVKVVVAERTRDYDITYLDGLEESYCGITRSVLDAGVLSLYRRARPSDAEEHVVSLPLVQVRKWVKT